MDSCICATNRLTPRFTVLQLVDILRQAIDYMPLQTYPRPDHPDPAQRGTLFQVLVQIVLSQRATLSAEREAARQLFRVFPDASSLSRADEGIVADLIRPAGLQRHKAKTVVLIAKEVLARYGAGLETLAAVSPGECRSQLLSLPGVGPKTADCFLELGLGVPILPIDVNIAMVARQFGFADPGDTYDAIQSKLQMQIPSDINVYRDVHSYLLAFGQRYCRKITQCRSCPVCSYYARGNSF